MSVGTELAQSSRSSEDQEVPSTVEEEFLKDVLASLQQALEAGEPVALAILAEVAWVRYGRTGQPRAGGDHGR